jgi:hypothetical protein
MPIFHLVSLVFSRASTYPVVVKAAAVLGYTLFLLLFFGLVTGATRIADGNPAPDEPIVQVRYQADDGVRTVSGTATLKTEGLTVTGRGEGTVKK